MDADVARGLLYTGSEQQGSQQEERTHADPRRLVRVRSAGHGLSFTLAAFAFCVKKSVNPMREVRNPNQSV
jgi:hypothetical protein